MNVTAINKKTDKINQLIKKYYKDEGILHRDQLLENEIIANISSTSKVLDAGCGYDAAIISKYCDLVGEAIGVDLVDNFETNSKVRPITADLEKTPFKNNYFDVIISRSICEHLIDPIKVFGELRRILKPGGRMIMVTPNKYYYSSVISKLFPMMVKKNILKNLYSETYENYPTYYRCNTKYQITKICKENKLRLLKLIALRHHPYYLRFSVFLFRIGILYDKLVSFLGIDWLQSSFLFVIVKEENDTANGE